MSYVSLVAAHKRLLGFGFTLCFFSSFGQTFFISLFGAEIRERFELTHGSFGALYSLATLASGTTLIWVGSAIDRIPLPRYTRGVVLGLLLATVLFASAPSRVLLVVALFTLRLFGQGLMGHTGMTTMARFFDTDRGKAMSVAALGFVAGEAILPRLFVGVKAAVDWRAAWVIVAVSVALIVVPFVEWLLRGMLGRTEARVPASEQPIEPPLEPTGLSPLESPTTRTSWSWNQVLRDPRFHLVMPAVLVPPFTATGIFFHQTALVDAKGWTLAWFADTFVALAATQLVSSLVAGPLVDRLRASRVMPFYLIPLTLAMAVLALGHHPVTAVAFMLLFGASGGAQSTVVGAYWAERYGVVHIGSIRSMVMAMMVFSTAAAPILLGRMIDSGVTLEAIAWMLLGYATVASVLAGVAVLTETRFGGQLRIVHRTTVTRPRATSRPD